MSTDTHTVIDITRGLLRVTDAVLLNLARLLPESDGFGMSDVRRHTADLLKDLDSQPETVLAAAQDDGLESLLVAFGPSDPFSSAPFVTAAELKPGDLVVRCAPALSSQMTEWMIWSRYTHVALYVGGGMIIDATWQHGVSRRALEELLAESNRVSVMRMNGLTDDQLQVVIRAAESRAAAGYNFEGVRVLGAQKFAALTGVSQLSLGELLTVLQKAEHLPPDASEPDRFACSELVVCAFRSVGVTLSHASGFTPGDLVRLGQAGQFATVGRLRPTQS